MAWTNPISLSQVPVSGTYTVTQGYGGYVSHNIQPYAVDFAVVEGTTVRPVSAGVVVSVGYNSDFGKYITVLHEGEFYATYAHLSSVNASVGDAVGLSSTLGLSGNTGLSTGPHLHVHFGTGLVSGRADGSSDKVPPAFFSSFFPASEVEGLLDAADQSSIFSNDIFGTSGSDGEKVRDDGFKGTDSAEWMFGGAGDDTLLAMGGDDDLVGGSGKDTIDGGLGSDTIYYSGRTAGIEVKLNGSSHATVFVGGVIEDTVRNIENVVGGKGADKLTGDQNANYLFGNSGDDTLKGGGGRDYLDGGAGNDTADFGDKTSSVRVTLNGSVQSIATVGGVAEDTLVNIENVIGGSAGDVLAGNSGANVLSGNAGNDVLVGNGGLDRLFGGSGTDYFDFNRIADSGNGNGNRVIVEDFSTIYDYIDLSTIDASSKLSGNNSFVWLGTSQFSTGSQGEVRYQKFDNSGTVNDYTVIYVDNDSDTASEMQIQLKGLINLSSTDFIF